ncbi:MAG: permease-like cell division protein FtsX [bacterium]|nr:permease-like cell division protein FtsX [bacterium]
MLTILVRIVKYGLQNFVRNSLLSVATIAVMVIALLMLVGLTLFNHVTESALVAVRDKIDISVYFKTSTAEDDVLRVKRSLEGLAEVKQVDYISRAEALQMFKDRHQNDDTITQAVTQLGDNPLSASLNIKAHDPTQYALISDYLNNDTLKQFIEKVSFAQNQTVIDRLALIIDTLEKGGFLLTLFLSLVAGLVIFNTIRLAIYSNREEIGIMRLVGASNTFIRGPYVFTGMIYGVIAAVLSILLIAPAVFFVSPYLEVFIPGLNFKSYFLSSLPIIILYQLLAGVLLGTISSYFALRKHLKV